MIGIIILTKNNITEFDECIRSIATTTTCEYRVYVADTGSTDDVKRDNQSKLKSIFNDNYKYIEYDYYNFAKINNDVVNTHIDDDIDILIFCNNDIVIRSANLLGRIELSFINNPNKLGTCGCRLLYPNGSIQHDGQYINIPTTPSDQIYMTHRNIGKYPANLPIPAPILVDGNTFALCGTERSLFEKIGMLTDKYIECFEDVEYNLSCRLDGRINVLLDGCYFATHHESISRGRTIEVQRKLQLDFIIIKEFIIKNQLELI